MKKTLNKLLTLCITTVIVVSSIPTVSQAKDMSKPYVYIATSVGAYVKMLSTDPCGIYSSYITDSPVYWTLHHIMRV